MKELQKQLDLLLKQAGGNKEKADKVRANGRRTIIGSCFILRICFHHLWQI